MSLKMKELPESERPYEKAQMYGTEVLSDSELLAIIIKCGTKEDTSVGLAQKILNLQKTTNQKDLRFLQNISIEELMQIKGIGRVKAIQIKATCELAKRMSRPIQSLKYMIKGTQDVAHLFMDELKYEKREIVKLLILNSQNEVLKNITITQGGISFASLEPQAILSEPVKMNASGIVLVHNHPGGLAKPSDEDIRATDRIKECADIMGICLIDHVIIAEENYISVLAFQKAIKEEEKKKQEEEKRLKGELRKQKRQLKNKEKEALQKEMKLIN